MSAKDVKRGNSGNNIKEKEKNIELGKVNNKTIRCSVKNCQKIIKPGEEVKIQGKVYCKECGAQIMLQLFAI